MATGVSKRQQGGRRAGAWALCLLGTPPNASVLQALSAGPRGLTELQGLGGSAGSTLRARLRELAAVGVVAQGGARAPRAGREYELTPAGEEILAVVEALERWLWQSPSAGHPFGGDCAKAAIGALVEGWSSTLLRALAVRPLSIAELDSLIGDLNYPSLERRIAAMRLAGQVRACAGSGRETPYAVTAWLRRGVAPILAAIRWERRHRGEDVRPVTALDVETAVLLALPLLRLEEELRGRCRLAIELPAGSNGGRRLAGAVAGVRDGEPVSCSSRLDGEADAWAAGSLAGWLAALIDGDHTSLELGGDGRLARALVAGLHRALFTTEVELHRAPG